MRPVTRDRDDDRGAVLVWVAVMLTVLLGIGPLVLGLAFLRTRSLALPLGIQFGWMQDTVLGFAVSGTTAPGVLQATLLDQAP